MQKPHCIKNIRYELNKTNDKDTSSTCVPLTSSLFSNATSSSGKLYVIINHTFNNMHISRFIINLNE